MEAARPKRTQNGQRRKLKGGLNNKGADLAERVSFLLRTSLAMLRRKEMKTHPPDERAMNVLRQSEGCLINNGKVECALPSTSVVFFKTPLPSFGATINISTKFEANNLDRPIYISPEGQ